MGDYRNDLQSALNQVEALRAENASLKVRLHASRDDAKGPPERSAEAAQRSVEPLPRDPSRARRQMFGASLVGAASIAGAAVLINASGRRAPPPDAPLMLRNLPVVPSRGTARGVLPMPPTTVRLPERARPDPSKTEVREGPSMIEPSPLAGDAMRTGLRWPADRPTDGLFVLGTTPDAECSVGGVRFVTPRPVFLPAGTHVIHCDVGSERHVWELRVAARHVTFDLNHPLRR